MITTAQDVSYKTIKQGEEYTFAGLWGEASYILAVMRKAPLMYSVSIKSNDQGTYRADVNKMLNSIVLPVINEFNKRYEYGAYRLENISPYLKLPIEKSQAVWTTQRSDDTGTTVHLITERGKKFGKVRDGIWIHNRPQIEIPLTDTLCECTYTKKIKKTPS